jgi:tetratricopeptide (TPR) repeat protein
VSGVVRRDRRALGVLLTAAAVLLGGWWFARLEPTHAPAPVAQGDGRYADAQVLLRRVIELAPRLPEAHVNMGFAWLGLQRAAQARESFEHALTLKADQANAYYGLALAQESLGDLELALGAMRSYLHLARDGSEAHLRRARSALWEWEAQIEQRRASARR